MRSSCAAGVRATGAGRVCRAGVAGAGTSATGDSDLSAGFAGVDAATKLDDAANPLPAAAPDEDENDEEEELLEFGEVPSLPPVGDSETDDEASEKPGSFGAKPLSPSA